MENECVVTTAVADVPSDTKKRDELLSKPVEREPRHGPRSMRHLDALQRFSLLRPANSANMRLHPSVARGNRNLAAAPNDQEDRNLARMLEDLLNQREQLERSHNWNQYSAVLKVLDEKLEETRLRLFYGREFDTTFVKRLKRCDDGSDANTQTWIDIDIPKDRGGHQNLVGRLVGPSGSTIKQLERDLDCKISIRGWALKRNCDLRNGVRFEESDGDDGRELYMKATVLPTSCTRTHLEYAKKALEHFVHNAVTTNADFDVLKKWQLIDLSKGRGQYRPVGRRAHRNDNENKPPKTAASTPAYDKSVSVPSLSTIQVPVRLIAVPQLSAPSYQLPTVGSVLAMSGYQPCYSAVELPTMTVEPSKSCTPPRPFLVTSSPPLCSVPDYGTQTQSSTPISLAVATPGSVGQSAPSSGSASVVQSSTDSCYSSQASILSPAPVYATQLQPSVQYASYATQYGAAQSMPVQYPQTLVCPMQTLYASAQSYGAQASTPMSMNVSNMTGCMDSRYVMLPSVPSVDNNSYPQPYVYYPGYMTSIASQQTSAVQQ